MRQSAATSDNARGRGTGDSPHAPRAARQERQERSAEQAQQPRPTRATAAAGALLLRRVLCGRDIEAAGQRPAANMLYSIDWARLKPLLQI